MYIDAIRMGVNVFRLFTPHFRTTTPRPPHAVSRTASTIATAPRTSAINGCYSQVRLCGVANKSKTAQVRLLPRSTKLGGYGSLVWIYTARYTWTFFSFLVLDNDYKTLYTEPTDTHFAFRYETNQRAGDEPESQISQRANTITPSDATSDNGDGATTAGDRLWPNLSRSRWSR